MPTSALRSFALCLAMASAGLALLAMAALGWSYPAIAAAGCPGCFGLERVDGRLVVEPAMPAEARARLARDIETARAAVAGFFGAFGREPVVVACVTEGCDRRLGGKGARAATMSMPFFTVLRVSPRGLNPTILAHEFAHVETHRRAGVLALLAGRLPAWFDEGLAVVVSGDGRYLGPGTTAAQQCLRDTDRPLPASRSDWGSRAGKDHMLYADAACRVLHWMEEHGGPQAAVAAVGDIGSRRRERLP